MVLKDGFMQPERLSLVTLDRPTHYPMGSRRGDPAADAAPLNTKNVIKRKRGMNRWLHHRRQEQKLVYFALFKVSSAKDKTKYIEESKQTAAKKTA